MVFTDKDTSIEMLNTLPKVTALWIIRGLKHLL